MKDERTEAQKLTPPAWFQFCKAVVKGVRDLKTIANVTY